MIRVGLSPEAEKDLIQIKNYITEDLDNLVAANRVLAGITKRISTVSEFPEIGPMLETIVRRVTICTLRRKKRLRRFLILLGVIISFAVNHDIN